jgi:xanthine dehydrogenase molybdopterin-binding subunit B
MSVVGTFAQNGEYNNQTFTHHVYAACSEVELDVLTGEVIDWLID